MKHNDENLKNNLEHIAHSLLQADRDLYRLCLYEQDKKKRECLISFFTLLTEIEKISLITTEPAMAALRLKWWYDSISKIDDIPDNAPQLLHHINLLLQSSKLDQTALLSLINLIQSEKEMHSSIDANEVSNYCLQKGEHISQILKANNTALLFSNLCFVRLARINTKITLENIEENKQKNHSLFFSKTDTYNQLLINKMNKKKPLKLSVLDLLKLHFS